jgi:excisionase family DNA binding protein
MNLINEDRLRLLMESVAEEAAEKVLARYSGETLSTSEILEEQDLLLTAKEAAALLKVSKTSLNNLRKSGLVPTCHIGPHVRFRRSDILELINRIQ